MVLAFWGRGNEAKNKKNKSVKGTISEMVSNATEKAPGDRGQQGALGREGAVKSW